MAHSERQKAMLKRYGLKRANSPKMTPKHPKKKAVVLASQGHKLKLIRFGAKGYGHNYSPEARHAANIKRGRMSAAYWADKFLWGGPSARKRQPSKGQRRKG